MSVSDRKGLSKWDLREESRYQNDSVPDQGSGKEALFLPKESQSGQVVSEGARSNGAKYADLETNHLLKAKHGMVLPSRKPLSGSRGSHKDNSIDRGHNSSMEHDMEWDRDESYSAKMSPGLDGWRKQNRSQSPRDGWSRSLRGRSRSRDHNQRRSHSRSRSRSPPYSLKRESRFTDRSRNRAGGSAQFNDDNWERGNRRGGASRYSTSQDYKDYSSRNARSAAICAEFVKGRCRRGASCRYAHENESDELRRGSSNEIRERINDRRNRDGYLDQGGEHEPSRSLDIPCKFFAAGNCRNGKHCRYSHHSQAYASSERKPRDDRWGLVHSPEDKKQLLDVPAWSDPVKSSDVTQLRDSKNEEIGAPKPRFTSWSVEDKRWGQCSNDESKIQSDQTIAYKTVESCNKGTLHGAGDAVGSGAITDVAMSPDWNYTVQSSSHVKRESDIATQDSGPFNDMAFATHNSHLTQELPVWGHEAVSFRQPVIVEKSCFTQGRNLMDEGIISSSNREKTAVESVTASRADGSFCSTSMHGQRTEISSELLVGGTILKSLPASRDGLSTVSSNNNGTTMPGTNVGMTTKDVVTSEQLTQLTKITVSLAQYLGNGQQVPQVYAALNSHNIIDRPSIPNIEAPVEQVSAPSVKSEPVVESQKIYDPIQDSIEHKDLEINNKPLGMLPSHTRQESDTDGKVPLPPLSSAGGTNGSELNGTSAENPNPIMQQLNQMEPAGDCNVAEKKKLAEDNGNKGKDSPENSALENKAEEEGVTDDKKGKNAKGFRAFKFALVELVKELLKPTWKEGQITKESYKTIVKKVVDKVTGTMQGVNVPQTQDKIDHYLSVSKQKVNKLVQAYVEKAQRAK